MASTATTIAATVRATAPTGSRIVVGVDGSRASLADIALEAAVHRVDVPAGTEITRLSVADPSPAKGLTRAARDATMLVVGADHRHGLGLLLGATARACIRQAVTPVVVVPSHPVA